MPDSVQDDPAQPSSSPASSKSSGSLDYNEIQKFLDYLKTQHGFNIGLNQYLAVQDLCLSLASAGKLVEGSVKSNQDIFVSYLSPIICSNPKQQKEFRELLNRWCLQYSKHAEPAKEGEEIVVTHSKWYYAGLGTLIVAALYALWVFVIEPQFVKPPPDIGTPDPPPPPPPKTGESQVFKPEPATPPPPANFWDELVGLYFVNYELILRILPSIPVLGWLLWWFYRKYKRRFILERQEAESEPKLEHISVKGETQLLYNDPLHRETLQKLRNYRDVPVHELNVDQTVAASAQEAGRFVPVFGTKKALPEYLILLDQSNPQDFLTDFYFQLVSTLEAASIHCDTYYFNSDPRYCYSDEDELTPHDIYDLMNKFPEHRLLVFSQGYGCQHPVTGKLQPWLKDFEHWEERTFFTPKDISNWGFFEEQLREFGFTLFPAGKLGLSLLSNHLQTGQEVEVLDFEKFLPEIELIEEAIRRAKDSDYETKWIKSLFEVLQYYLGDDAYLWLRACAVYPEVTWDLTLYIGAHLKNSEGERVLSEEGLIKLSQLPWFRRGIIPDEFRVHLIAVLSKKEEEAIRLTLKNLLDHPTKEIREGIRLDVAQKPKALASFWSYLKGLFKSDQTVEEKYEYVFLNFMMGNPTNKLQFGVPSGWKKLIYSRGLPGYGVRPWLVFGLTAVAVIAFWKGTENWTPAKLQALINQGKPVDVVSRKIKLNLDRDTIEIKKIIVRATVENPLEKKLRLSLFGSLSQKTPEALVEGSAEKKIEVEKELNINQFDLTPGEKTWTLVVADELGQTAGKLLSWDLTVIKNKSLQMTFGDCNPVITDLNGNVTITCKGLSPRNIQKLNEILRDDLELEEKIKQANLWKKKYDQLKESLISINYSDPSYEYAFTLLENGEIEKLNSFLDEVNLKKEKMLADDYFIRSKILRLEKQFNKALNEMENAFKIDPKNGLYLEEIGLNYHLLGNFDKAVEYYEKALTIYQSTLKKNDPQIVKVKKNLSFAKKGKTPPPDPKKAPPSSKKKELLEFQQRQKNRSKAVVRQQSSSNIPVPAQETESPQVTEEPAVPQQQSNSPRPIPQEQLKEQRQGNIAPPIPQQNQQQAIPDLKSGAGQSIDFFEEPPEPQQQEPLDLEQRQLSPAQQQQDSKAPRPIPQEKAPAKENSQTWSKLGTTAYERGDYDKAIAYFEKALASDRNTLGENHPNVAENYTNLGLAWLAKENYGKAIEFYEKALKVDIRAFGENHPKVAIDQNSLGFVLYRSGNYDKAISYYEKALANNRKTLGGEHPNSALSLGNLGAVWKSKGDYTKAIKFFKEALIINLKTFGESHPQVAGSYQELGNTYVKSGQFDLAIENLEKALEIIRKSFGENHPRVISIQKDLNFARDQNSY